MGPAETEVARIMQICNACRYCEGFCAVFPAMTRRLEFTAADTHYLANLCHNCGACLHACQYAPPNPFGVNVPRMLTLTYGAGVALAAFAGVLAAPIYSVNPSMGANFIITVFAVVVIGGMGSILGSIVTGFALGFIEGATRVIYPEASATVVFVIMAIVLLTRPTGLFGRA